MKRIWSDDRSELTLNRIRSMALIKFNSNQTCIEFFNSIRDQPDILRAIKNGDKYKQNNIRMNNRALQLSDAVDVETSDVCC